MRNDPRREAARRRGRHQRLVLAVGLASIGWIPTLAHAVTDQPHPRLHCATQPAACQRAISWARTRRQHDARRINELRAHLRRVHEPTAREAAFLASRALGVDPWAMLRVGNCETGGTLDPYAVNHSSGATGWLQFMASTWARTPFAAWPRTNPYAQALAAAQIVRADGGYQQWSCGSAAR